MSTDAIHPDADPAPGGDPKPVGERVEEAVEELIDQSGGEAAPTDVQADRVGDDAVDDETFTA